MAGLRLRPFGWSSGQRPPAAPPLLLLIDPSRSVAATVLTGQLQRAYFAALPDLAIGRVAELIGWVQQAGLTRIGFVTETPAPR